MQFPRRNYSGGSNVPLRCMFLDRPALLFRSKSISRCTFRLRQLRTRHAQGHKSNSRASKDFVHDLGDPFLLLDRRYLSSFSIGARERNVSLVKVKRNQTEMEFEKDTVGSMEMYHDESLIDEKENVDPRTGRIEGVRTRSSTGPSVERMDASSSERSPLMDITRFTHRNVDACQGSKDGKGNPKQAQAYYTGHVDFQSTQNTSCSDPFKGRRGLPNASSLR